MMKPRLLPLAFFTAFAGTLAAQSSVTRHKLELDSAGVFPVAGYKSDEYLAAPPSVQAMNSACSDILR